MTRAWYLFLCRLFTRLYFDRATVIYPERLPKSGPALYVGLHRNGAVDGFVYHSVLPRATFLISTQLRRNWLGKLFFTGIEVVRDKDKGDRSMNVTALQRCRELLQAGGELIVFPEGTSTLGPRHLPFRSGAARIVLDCLDAGLSVKVVPLGITYDCPWAFRSRVEIVVGLPVSTELSASLSAREQFDEMRARLQAALEAVGINVESNEYQKKIQRLANLSALNVPLSYYKALKSLEKAIPDDVLAASRSFEEKLKQGKFLFYHEVPLFPLGPSWVALLALLVLGPFLLAAALVNLIPLLAAHWAGKQLPDDLNVVSLWKILVGVPLFVLWLSLLGGVVVGSGKFYWFAAYCVLTLLGFSFYSRTKQLIVAVGNAMRHPEMKPELLALRKILVEKAGNARA